MEDENRDYAVCLETRKDRHVFKINAKNVSDAVVKLLTEKYDRQLEDLMHLNITVDSLLSS